MLHGTGFGDCDDITAAHRPGQRNGCCRATARCANTCKRGVTQQAGAGAAERRISLYWHTMSLAPWQQVTSLRWREIAMRRVEEVIEHESHALGGLFNPRPLWPAGFPASEATRAASRPARSLPG